MFRRMRRKKQELSKEEVVKVLERCTSGVLAVLGDDDYSYAVPLSYVYHDNKIYFHCANDGHKMDAIRKHNKVSFCVIDEDTIVPEEFTSYFRSVIVFGRARILERKDVKEALDILSAKYSPEMGEARMKEVESCVETVCMVAIDIEHMTGKEAIEYAKRKKDKDDK